MARTHGSHAELTGPRIRKAAERLFAQSGYAAVSMRKIAAEVGVQVGALYNYIPDKQALLFDLMDSHMRELLDARALRDVGQDAMARLEDFTRFHIRFHLKRPDAVFIAYMELRNLSEANFEKVEARRRLYEEELADILQQGMDEGTCRVADVRVATRAVIAMLTGVTTWYRAEGALSAQDVEEVYWQMVRKAVAA